MEETKNNTNTRIRGENWTQEEKDLFLEIMRESAPIVENKLTDTNTNRRKKLEWLNIQNKLKELTGKPREVVQLKGFWRRSKIAAKKNVSQHRRALHATGGGQRPPSPSPEDLKILEFCPTDFVIDENIYDSDSVPQAVLVPDEPLVNGDNNTIHRRDSTLKDLDEDFDILPLEEGETVTVTADVHNKENNKAPSAKKTEVKKNITCKTTLLNSNLEIKKQAMEMMVEEHKLKMKYHRQELAHQELKHRMEIGKIEIEIELLKKKLKE